MNGRTQFQGVALSLVLLAALVAPKSGEAQRSDGSRARAKVSRSAQSDEKRFTFGVYTLAAPGLSITGDDIDGTFTTKLGEGGGAMLGYAITPRIIGYASLDVAKQAAGSDDYRGSTFGLAHFEIGARAMLPMNSPTTPYLSASFGSRAIAAHVHDFADDSNYDISLTGTMFGLGGGVERALSSTMSFDAGAEMGFGTFTHYKIADESGPLKANGSTSIRLRLGLTWRR